MKTVKATELQNAQVPIQDLANQAKYAVKTYLDVANSCKRSSSHLSSLFSSFLNNDYGKGVASEYINIITEALLTLTKDKASKALKDELGDYYFERFTTRAHR